MNVDNGSADVSALETSVSVKPLRALQIGQTTSESGGGGTRYYFDLLRALPSSGVSGVGLVSGDLGRLSRPSPHVSSFAPPNAGILQRWSALRRGVSEALPAADLTVSHFAAYALPVLDTIRSKPFVVHFHGPWALESAAEGAGRAATLAKHLIERVVYSRATRAIVLSRAFASILERQYGVRADTIRVVPGGVDLQRFQRLTSKREAKESLGWPSDRPTVVSVRRLVRAKGLENLIDAVLELKKTVPDILVIIAGRGPLAEDLQRRTRELQLDHWVRFAGFIAEESLSTLYRAADLFVVPTIALEGFGLVVLEALACGTPVLVTPVAGLPEVVTNLEPGLVLGGASARDIARGVSDALLGRVQLPSEEQCVAYAQRFDWPKIGERVADVYREIA
jgi:glycosyltransferase involved in cell wall biosynthesis